MASDDRERVFDATGYSTPSDTRLSDATPRELYTTEERTVRFGEDDAAVGAAVGWTHGHRDVAVGRASDLGEGGADGGGRMPGDSDSEDDAHDDLGTDYGAAGRATSRGRTKMDPAHITPSMISATVTDVIEAKDAATGKNYTAYSIAVEFDGQRWTMLRRYRQFHELHTTLQKPDGVQFPAFPPKTVLRVKDAAGLEKRRVALDGFIQFAISQPQVLHEARLQTFLGLDVRAQTGYSQEMEWMARTTARGGDNSMCVLL